MNSIPPSEDSVLFDYVGTNNLLNSRAGALHMFFSPHRIPAGLTDEEVSICILLYPIKQARIIRKNQGVNNALRKKGQTLQEDEYLDSGSDKREDRELKLFFASVPMYMKIGLENLPIELRPCDEPMTRKRFKEGIYKFLQQMTT